MNFINDDLTKYWLTPYLMFAEGDEDEGGGEQQAATTEGETTEEQEAAAKVEGEEKPAKKAWYMDRIDGLTRKLNEEISGRQTLSQQNSALRTTLETLLAAGVSPRDAARVATGQADDAADAGNTGRGRAAEGPAGRLYTEAELNSLAERKAGELAAAQSVSFAEQQFNNRCNEVAAAGNTKFPDFNASLNALGAAGVLPQANMPLSQQPAERAFLEAVTELDDPAGILHHLGKNPEEAMRLKGLKAVPLAMALTKLSGTLAAAPAPKPASNAPPPVTTVTGTGTPGALDLDSPDLPMAEFVKRREEAVKTRH